MTGKGQHRGEAGSWEEKVAFLQAELERAKSREDLFRLQMEETRSKAGQAFAFQVELAQQQEETLEEYHKRERAMLSELEAAKKEAGRAGDLAARLAVVPMVLEARGLDVTPRTVEGLAAHGDTVSAALLQTIHDDEITHVAAGRRWFEFLCARRGVEPVAEWHALLARYFGGRLKPPFNDESRALAGLTPAYYRGENARAPS